MNGLLVILLMVIAWLAIGLVVVAIFTRFDQDRDPNILTGFVIMWPIPLVLGSYGALARCVSALIATLDRWGE